MLSQRLIAIIALIMVNITIMGCESLDQEKETESILIAFGIIFFLIILIISLDGQAKKKEEQEKVEKAQRILKPIESEVDKILDVYEELPYDIDIPIESLSYSQHRRILVRSSLLNLEDEDRDLAELHYHRKNFLVERFEFLGHIIKD